MGYINGKDDGEVVGGIIDEWGLWLRGCGERRDNERLMVLLLELIVGLWWCDYWGIRG